MEELNVNNQLQQQDLYKLFKIQLKKDFESAGLLAEFVDTLPAGYIEIRSTIITALEPLFSNSSTLLASLLYRVDISEQQLEKYAKKNTGLSFPEIVAELIIKRILQKVILKKTFLK